MKENVASFEALSHNLLGVTRVKPRKSFVVIGGIQTEIRAPDLRNMTQVLTNDCYGGCLRVNLYFKLQKGQGSD